MKKTDKTKATESQQKTLEAIKLSVKQRGYPPTRRELAVELEVNVNAVTDSLKVLVKKGKISIDANVSRGIRINEK